MSKNVDTAPESRSVARQLFPVRDPEGTSTTRMKRTLWEVEKLKELSVDIIKNLRERRQRLK